MIRPFGTTSAEPRDGVFPWAGAVLGSFFRGRGRDLGLRLFAYLGIAVAALGWSLWGAGIRWQWSPSGPQWIYRLSADPEAVRGAWVAVCLDGPVAATALLRGYVGRSDDCPAGVEPILKRVWAVAGERVDRGRLPEPLLADAAGRPLEPWTGTRVGPGEVWLRSIYDAPSTFDSKYYGPVPVGWVRWSAQPLLWRGPPPTR